MKRTLSEYALTATVAGPDDGEMRERRVAALVILAGAAGLVVGLLLFTRSEVWTTSVNIWFSYIYLWLGLSLILLGLATRYLMRFGVGTLLAIGLLAVLTFWMTLNDFFDGDPVWPRAHSGIRLVGSSLIVVSMAAVLIGVLWSAVHHLTDGAAATTWWRRRSVLAVGGVAALSIIGTIGFAIFGDKDVAQGPTEVADEGDVGPVPDEWSITPDGDAAGSYIFSMVKTFSPMEEADVDDLGGRLVWPETEVELCDVGIYSAGDAFVRIGIESPTTEGCPGMLPAFVDFGVPERACLFVRSGGVDDEYCAPLQATTFEP